jgi:hypothetical protein
MPGGQVMGDIREITVPARGGAPMGEVSAGESWCFHAHGRWWDWMVPCGPDGYRFFLADVLDVRPTAPDRPFFELMARVLEDPERVYPIGKSATVTFLHSGSVQLFANDATGAFFQVNNWGAIQVVAQPCDCPPPPVIKPEGDLLGRWTLLRDTLDKTRGVGFAVLLSLGACLLLLNLQQGRDLVRTVAESGAEPGQRIAFALGLLFLAIQTWIWPRMIISSNYGRDREQWRPRRLLHWAPRLLGAAPFLLVILAIWNTPATESWFIAALAGLGLVFFVTIIIQYDVRSKIREVVEKRGRPIPPLPVGRLWVIASFAIAVAMMVWAVVSPVNFGWTLGSPAVVFFGVGCIIPVLAVMIQTGRAARVPTLTLLLGAAIVFGLYVDNHAVGGRYGHVPEPTPPSQISLEQAYDRWVAAQGPLPLSQPRTLVLIAAEGGASRAGYWTAEVLSALHKATSGELARRLFAISSVSGGSVGAVAYAATLQDRPDLDAVGLTESVTAFAGQDFLSPTVGGLLFPDLLQRFLPAAFLPDRAQGLEQAFERGWSKHCAEIKSSRACANSDLISGPFTNLRAPENGWRPLVIINGASQETGRRILTSHIRFKASEVDADDFYDMVDREIPVSTAIHNGARFPWISPAGTMVDCCGRTSHIVDGGYFEAAGVELLREMAPALRTIAKRKGHTLRIVFVYIGYREKVDTASEPTKAAARERGSTFTNEVTAPLAALFSSRSAHAGHLIRELKQDVSGDPANTDPTRYVSTTEAHYEPVLLCKQEAACPRDGADFEPPMNWALSGCAKAYMGQAAGRTLKNEERAICQKVLRQPPRCQEAIGQALSRLAIQINGPAKKQDKAPSRVSLIPRSDPLSRRSS